MGIVAVDTSALMAVLFDEPERAAFMRCLAQHTPLISPINFVESANVSASRLKLSLLDALMDEFAVAIHPADERHARLARETYRRFGKGNHAAGLNLGDCFAYALAAAVNAPLLYKGDDFAKTDIANALED